jgi:adenylate kinase
VLRENVENSTPLGKQAKPILDRGEYLPDELMCPLIGDWLERQSDGWVLDGFPRSLPQARFLDEWLADRGASLDAAVALDVPYDELLFRIRNRVECPECRWTGQKSQTVDDRCPVCDAAVKPRPDDSEENFNSRFREFERLTLPVIEHYRALKLLFPCDATASKDEVAEKLYRQLTCLAGR